LLSYDRKIPKIISISVMEKDCSTVHELALIIVGLNKTKGRTEIEILLSILR
jgi:hypothetical protein